MSYQRFIALGDSFTEGLNDDLVAIDRHLGWADRAARALTDLDPRTRYANLAVRGRLAAELLAEQVPAAISLEPDLVSVAIGVNDALRRGFDLEATSAALNDSVAALSSNKCRVVVFAFGDPSRRSRVFGSIRERLRAYREETLRIADEHGAMVVDFWDCAVFDDDRMWSSDRLHLSPRGHAIAARAFMETIGVGDDTWRTPPVAAPRSSLAARRVDDARWLREFAGPWIHRRLRGVSSGDGINPKFPSWVSLAQAYPHD